MKILIAVDGSKCSLSAVKSLISHAGWYRGKPRVELVNVRFPVPPIRGMGRVVSKEQIARYYREEGAAELARAKKLLDAARISHADHILIGQPAEAIVELTTKRKCDLILIGSQGRSALGNMLVGSVATKVLRLSRVPVQLVR